MTADARGAVPPDRPWFRQYPPGVAPAFEPDPRETIPRMLARSCAEFPDRPAFASFGHSISFREFDDLTARFGAGLQRLGLRRGDRVAVMMPNILQFPVAAFGALRAGLVVVNVNPLYTAHELEHQLRDAGARALVAVEMAGAVVQKALPAMPVEHVILTGLADLLPWPQRTLVNATVRYVRRIVPPYDLPSALRFTEVLAGEAGALRAPELTGTDLAFLQYTGGTTGVPKGAMLTHGNLMANVRQINSWFHEHLQRGGETMITALPLYHIYALTCNCLAYLDIGGLNVFIVDPRNLRAMIREMGKWRFTAITGVNTLYEHLANHPDLRSVDFSALKVVSAGGMAVMAATARRWFQVTGKPIVEGYGLSETSPVITINRPDLAEYSGSIGLPLPGTDVSLRDDDGHEVPQGQAGELCVRGPQVMPGYWNQPAETAAVMTPDGYFRTGDIAEMDPQGYLRIVDRKKDMISVSGLKAYPNEIEQVVSSHPAVLECACIGVPDPDTREAVKVFVVLRPGAALTADELRAWCRESLAAYKVPRYVEFRGTLPKSNVGKILRRALR